MFIPRECWSSHLASSIFVCKVTWCRTVWTSINTGIGLIDVICVIDSASTANKTGTIAEHSASVSHFLCTPFVSCIDSGQRRTATEHTAHDRHIGCIEAAYIKTRQGFTFSKHILHIRCVSRIETT